MDALTGRRQSLGSLYERSGPFTTVYLDATRNTESGEHEVRLRWADVRRELESRGADKGAEDATLDSIEAVIDADAATPGRHGLVVVAAEGAVCLHDVLRDPPAQSTGSVSPLPHLMPYLAQRVEQVPHVVVVADRSGADVLAIAGSGEQAAQVQGSHEHPLHRTGRDDWSERHFQQRVENNWQANARDVADAVHRQVEKVGAALVVVAGEVRARALVAEALHGVLAGRVTVVAVEAGGRAAGASAQALEEAVHDEVLRVVWRHRRDVLEHAQQNLGRAEYAVAGVAPVVDALRMAQVDTLIVSDDPSSTLRGWVGPGMTDFGLDSGEAAALNIEVLGEDRLDAALVRAAVGTNAQLVITPGAHEYVEQGVAALLRY